MRVLSEKHTVVADTVVSTLSAIFVVLWVYFDLDLVELIFLPIGLLQRFCSDRSKGCSRRDIRNGGESPF